MGATVERKATDDSYAAWGAAFLDALRAERRASPYTVRNYAAALDRFETFLTDHLGGAPDLAGLASLDPRDFRAFLASRRREGVSAQTVKLDLSAVRAFWPAHATRASLRLCPSAQ